MDTSYVIEYTIASAMLSLTSKNCLRENIVRERELYWIFHTLLTQDKKIFQLSSTTQLIGVVCSFLVEQIANNLRKSSAASVSVDRNAILLWSAPCGKPGSMSRRM